MKLNLNLEIDFDDKWVEYFESAIFERGYIDYWGNPFREKGEIVVYEFGDDPDGPPKSGTRLVLPKDWIAQGLKYLAERKDEDGHAKPYYRLHELLRGDYDAESLDVLVQAAIFKDLVYG